MSNPTNNNGRDANRPLHDVESTGHERDTYAPQPAAPVRGETVEHVQTKPVKTEPATGSTSVGEKKKFPWWVLIPLLLLLLGLFALRGCNKPAPAPSPTATPTAAATTSSPTMTASPTATTTASATRSATSSATSSGSASGTTNSITDMDKVASAVGIKCDQWNNPTTAAGVDVKTCAQGTDASFAEMFAGQSQKLDDTYWKGFATTYNKLGSYVVTDKNKFAYITGGSKAEADAIAKQTGQSVYTITANGLQNA